MKKLNILIIGCGKIAGLNYTVKRPYSCHASAYSNSSSVDNIYYFDIDVDKSTKLSNIFRGLALNSLDGLTNKNIDIVSICTPVESHFSVISEVRSKICPKLIFVEKPVCHTREEYARLQKFHESIPIIVNQSRRFDPRNVELKDVIANETYGKIQSINVLYYGGFSSIACHIIDQLYFLGLNSFEQIKVSKNHYSKRHKEDSLDLKCFSGKTPINFFSFNEDNFQVSEIDILLSNGRIKIENFGEEISYYEVLENSNNERVLNLVHKSTEQVDLIETGIEKLINCCISEDLSSLHEFNITTVKETMNTIWEVIDHGSK